MSFLYRLHQELRGALITRRGATGVAGDVPTFQHKSYPRMPVVDLPEPTPIGVTLSEALYSRKSAFGGDPERAVALQDFSTLLGMSLRKHTHDEYRNYPSSGALYPIETYVLSTALGTEAPGVFHYDPSRHVLERLWGLPSGFDIKSLAPQPPDLRFSSLIVFTSVWARSTAKYGDLAYQHALLEAGHMSENILLVGTALGLALRPHAGFDDALVQELLDLDESEQAVHTITVSR